MQTNYSLLVIRILANRVATLSGFHLSSATMFFSTYFADYVEAASDDGTIPSFGPVAPIHRTVFASVLLSRDQTKVL